MVASNLRRHPASPAGPSPGTLSADAFAQHARHPDHPQAFTSTRTRLHSAALAWLNDRLVADADAAGLVLRWQGLRLVAADAPLLMPAVRRCQLARSAAGGDQRLFALDRQALSAPCMPPCTRAASPSAPCWPMRWTNSAPTTCCCLAAAARRPG